jgi:hypothetical protein
VPKDTCVSLLFLVPYPWHSDASTYDPLLRSERLEERGATKAGELSLHESYVQAASMKIQEDAEDLEWLRELDSRMLGQQWSVSARHPVARPRLIVCLTCRCIFDLSGILHVWACLVYS